MSGLTHRTVSEWQTTFVFGAVIAALGFAAHWVWDWILCAGIVVMVGSAVWASWHGKLVWESPADPPPPGGSS